LGGYPTAATTFGGRERFYGSIDDLAFYSRLMTDTEIKQNWMKVADITDTSLFIYYNFDDGPGTKVIKNYGSVGSQADLYNGQLMGGTTYTDTHTETTNMLTPASFSPGAPITGASATTPLVYAVDAKTTVQLQVKCFPSSAVATSVMPTQATFTTTFAGNGVLYQADSTRTQIISYPALLTSTSGYFWYGASNIDGSLDSIAYSCMCGGQTQTGMIKVITTAKMVPDPTITAIVISTTTPIIYLHGSIAHPGLPTINISSLPTLGRLSQLDFWRPQVLNLITHPNTMLTNPLCGVRYIPYNSGTSGPDSFSFFVMHGGLVSSTVTVQVHAYECILSLVIHDLSTPSPNLLPSPSHRF